MHFVYILKSLKDGKRYIGLTNNLDRRLNEHNNGEVTSTKNRKPFTLIHYEPFTNRSEAAKREKFLKTGVSRRELERLLSHYSHC